MSVSANLHNITEVVVRPAVAAKNPHECWLSLYDKDRNEVCIFIKGETDYNLLLEAFVAFDRTLQEEAYAAAEAEAYADVLAERKETE